MNTGFFSNFLLPIQQESPWRALTFLTRLSTILLPAMIVLTIFGLTPLGASTAGVTRLLICVSSIGLATALLSRRILSLSLQSVLSEIRAGRNRMIELLSKVEDLPAVDRHQRMSQILQRVREFDDLEDRVAAIQSRNVFFLPARVSRIRDAATAILDRIRISSPIISGVDTPATL